MVTNTRTVSDYSSVSLRGSLDVEWVKGKEGKLVITAESNLLEYIETEVKGGDLEISIRKGINLNPSRNYQIKITVPVEEISGVALTGSGNIVSKQRLNSLNFEVDLTGSGDINLNLDVKNLNGKLTGTVVM